MGCVGASSAPQPTAVTLKCPLTHGGLPTFHSALFVRVKAPSTPLCWAWLPLEKLKWEKATGDFSFIKMQVLRHSEHTLKTALISKNPELVSLYEKFNAGEQRLMNEAFQLSSSLFGPISVHSRSDWITSHPEAPQDFEQFFTDRYRNKPCPEKHIIYIQSIGSLGNTRVISEEYIKWLKGYCEAFFYGLTVKFLEPVSVSATRCAFRVNEHTQNLQIHAGHILAFLKKKKPQDAFCIVGITMIDLYPRDSWNFVFGQASLTDGVGIFSFARYGKDFYSTRYEGTVKQPQRTSSSDYSIFDNYYNPEITSILLWRSCKVEETEEPSEHSNKKENICWHGKVIISQATEYGTSGLALSTLSACQILFFQETLQKQTSTIWNSETHVGLTVASRTSRCSADVSFTLQSPDGVLSRFKTWAVAVASLNAEGH